VWCPFVVVWDICDSDLQIAIDGTPGDGVNVSRVDAVGGDVLGRFWFEFFAIFVLGFVNDVRCMTAAIIGVGGI